MRTALDSHAMRPIRQAGVVAAAVVVGLALSGTVALAQMSRVSVTLEFAFSASGKEMPAGRYMVEAQPGRVTIQPQGGNGSPIVMPVITRLGRHDNDAEPELVFDKIDGKFLLSEVWLPGADGYLLLATSTEHDHAVHGGPKARK
jgi:hypothetical protein